MKSAASYDIAIVGYGIAGIAAAVLLRRAGHRITHFESASAVPNAGAGLLLQPIGVRALRSLGLGEAVAEAGSRVSQIASETRDGRVLMCVRYDEFKPDAFAVGIERRRLLEILAAADACKDHVHFAHQVSRIDAERGMVETATHGAFGPFDVVVGADGASSAVRASLPSDLCVVSRQYETSALVTVLDDPMGRAGDRLVQRFDGARHVSYWPVGTRRAAIAVNLFDASEHTDSMSVFTQLAAPIQPLVAKWLSEQRATPATYHYRYADIELARFNHRRVALIGDAAHAMSPQLGLGSSMGIVDAQALFSAIESCNDITGALCKYDAIRRPVVAEHQKNSRLVTPLFQSNAASLVLLRNRALSQLGRFANVRRTMLSRLF